MQIFDTFTANSTEDGNKVEKEYESGEEKQQQKKGMTVTEKT